jgi:hypothetical protein
MEHFLLKGLQTMNDVSESESRRDQSAAMPADDFAAGLSTPQASDV